MRRANAESSSAGAGKKPAPSEKGRLRIGDNWNAITIIALSQNNPLKAIAEFVENSIDAGAKHVTIVRGRNRGEQYLKVVDDGAGIPRDTNGVPDFRYVATHICDSAKRRLREEGAQGLQGEFGIGLLSFWTVGEKLTLACADQDERTFEMEMTKGNPGYRISRRRSLFSHPGTELTISPLLPGLRQLAGERIQAYLASELRDRIRTSGVSVRIKDRSARKELVVKPREYTGRHLPEFVSVTTELGPVTIEIHLCVPSPDNTISLYRSGTRVLSSLTTLQGLDREPWSSGYLQGMLDAPFLQLTPGTRDGVIHDHAFDAFCRAIAPLEERLREIVRAEQEADEEETSRKILKNVQHALREALLALPQEDYSWFDILRGTRKPKRNVGLFANSADDSWEPGGPGANSEQSEAGEGEKRKFHEYPGPLHNAVISPSSVVIKVGEEKSLRCIPRDKSRRLVEEGLVFQWSVKDGEGSLSDPEAEIVSFSAPGEPGISVVQVLVTQGESRCVAEAIVTTTESLVENGAGDGSDVTRGLPGYTFVRAPGELWRSRFDEGTNVIVINNGHGDYLFAAQKRARKIKYIGRLFAKELVLKSFPGFEPAQLLERMIELSLYMEEHLR